LAFVTPVMTTHPASSNASVISLLGDPAESIGIDILLSP